MLLESFDLSRSDVENLLTGFLSGALGMELIVRLKDLNDLPKAWRTQVQLAENSGDAWIAWSTRCGPIAAWGRCDLQGSRRINACLLRVEWCDTLGGHHSLWSYCDPKRPIEWTVGRG